MKSKIEISPNEFHIRCTYDEAVIYCFQLDIDGKTGWRLPTREEYEARARGEQYILHNSPWFVDDYDLPTKYSFPCIPVRTI